MGKGKRKDVAKKITDMKKRRSVLKASLTKLRNKVRTILESEENLSREILDEKASELDEAWGKFQNEHKSILKQLERDEDQDDEIEELHLYLDKEKSLMANILEKIADKQLQFREDIEVHPEDSVSNGSGSHSSQRSRGASSSVTKAATDQIAERKALEARLKMAGKHFEIESKKKALQRQMEDLEQEEEMLKLQSQLAQVQARESVYVEACQMEREVYTSVNTPCLNADIVGKDRNEEQSPNASVEFASTVKHNCCENVNNNAQIAAAVDPNKMMALLQQQQLTNAMALTLPTMEVPVFTGDPTDYCYFITSFESMIASKTVDFRTKLYYLVQHTAGHCQELMKSCLVMESKEGYEEALKLLKKRYGQEYRITSALIEKLLNGPQLKNDDIEGFQRYSVLMTSSENTLREIGHLSQMDNPDNLRRIIARLPYDARKRWRSIADNISEVKEREIVFHDVVEFVNREARMMTHPIFGDLSDKINESGVPQYLDQTRRYQPRHKANAFATQSYAQSDQTAGTYVRRNSECALCKGDHPLAFCEDFIRKNVEERAQFALISGTCFNCLTRTRHIARDCNQEPGCQLCPRKHSTLLHQETRPMPPLINNGFVRIPGTNKSFTSMAIGLPIVPVKVKSQGKTVITYAFLDSGSTSTFCTEDLMKDLQLPGKKTTFSLTTLEKQSSPAKSFETSLEVYDIHEKYMIELPTVFSRKNLPISLDDRHTQDDLMRWPHLRSVNLPNVNFSETTGRVDILIGNDNCSALEPKDVKASKDGGPYAVKTIFGWVINGPLGRAGDKTRHTANFVKTDSQLSIQFENFCKQEFSDVAFGSELAMSQEDKQAVQIMTETISLKNKHYELSLPFRHSSPDMPNNRQLAEHRLNLLRRRLEKNTQLFEKYCECIDKLMDNDYAESVPKCELTSTCAWYLPHHPVINPKKPDKLRVVFDCSAKYKDMSLNDMLLQGPDQTNSLVGVLTRFRQEPVALMSDIEAMFHQVRVTHAQRDALRFLWWPNHDMSCKPEERRMNVHLFGATSSPSCCNFALRQTAEDNKEDFSSEIYNTVYHNFYVDDCLKSVGTVEEGKNLVEQLSLLLAKGGFRLTKWLSNSQEVNETIPETERATLVKNLDFDEVKMERALGMLWNITEDHFTFKVDVNEKPPTRRGILSIMSSVYDPLGFVSPLVLPIKNLLQELSREKLPWDEEIQGGKLKFWNNWLTSLVKLEGFKVNRCVKPKGFGKIAVVQLHHFSDGSEIGYGAVTYLRLIDVTGQIHCAFLMSKSRVAPTKTLTIPRLELSAAAISAKLDQIARRELDFIVDQSLFWTDSTSVLKYLNNQETRFQTFVANRISRILSASGSKQWRFVDGKHNPADESSRGLLMNDLLANNRWLNGPDFLWKTEEHWPDQPKELKLDLQKDPEVKNVKKMFVSHVHSDKLFVQGIIERFSSWYKLRKFVAWMMRYKANLKNSIQTSTRSQIGVMHPITLEELQHAETVILNFIQEEHFHEEIVQLSKKNENESCFMSIKKTSSLRKLDPFMENGLLRVGGRLRRSLINDDAKHQIILPQKNHVTQVIVRHYHIVLGHSGREHVLSEVRRKYWIPKGGAVVRGILSKCVDCKKRFAKPESQRMANLPKNRVLPCHPPFTFVGIDFFGPFLVRRARSEVKRYGCIFTCLSTRGIHLEVTHSMSSDSFLNAFRRFTARRGTPTEIRSDNGGCFVSASKELRQEVLKWNKTQTHAFFLKREIKWLFNPPTASHFGGVWERCIRSVRKVLGSLLKEQILDDEGLLSLMCEAEAILNSRPLTKLSEDSRDLQVLTPNHLLLMRHETTLPLGVFKKEECYVRRRWRQIQYMADQFWKRWILEYLPILQERQKWTVPKRNIAKGDVVLLVGDKPQRSSWPLALVLETFPDEDGCVRRVQVKTHTGVLNRPIHKCVLLEASDN